MSKVLVLHYSSYGHVEALADAVAEGACSTGAIELAGARHQGELIARTANKLFG